MVQPCNQVLLIPRAKPKFTKHKSWNLSNRGQDGIVVISGSYLCNHFCFHSIKRLERESLVSFLQQDNHVWAEGTLGDHALCFVGPPVWLAALAWKNVWKQGKVEGGGGGWGMAGDMGATEGAGFYSTPFVSKHPPIAACLRQSGNTNRQVLITIYTLFNKSHLLATFPWYFLVFHGSKRTSLPKAEHTHSCFIPQFSQIIQQYLFSSNYGVGAGECQNQMCKIPFLPLRRSLFCLGCGEKEDVLTRKISKNKAVDNKCQEGGTNKEVYHNCIDLKQSEL